VIRIAFALLALSAQLGLAQERVELPQAVSRRATAARQVGRANLDDALAMSITLPVRHQAELAALIEAQQRLGSPEYHHWLSPEEFAARFAPAPEEYETLARWLESQGFSVRRWESRVRLDFSGTVDRVEQSFGVRMNYYVHRGGTHLANENAPLVPAEFADRIALLRLNTFPLARPLVRPAGVSLNTMAPHDLQIAYNARPVLDRGIDGAGQIIAVVARSDYSDSDVVQFQQEFGGSPLKPVKVFPQGTSPGIGAPNGVCRGVQPYAERRKCIWEEKGEVLLDVQWANAMAPGATVLVDIAGPALGVQADIDQSLFDIVNHHPEAKVITMSFGACERVDSSDHALFAPAYAQAAAQGQTVLVATGDDGVNDCGDGQGASVNVLATDSNVTAVGGTALDPGFDAGGNATGYRSESVWNDQYGASGGGISSIVAVPSYQLALGLSTGGFRSVPDVSLLASPISFGYVSVVDGNVSLVGGTSAGAPSWAGVIALLNQTGHPSGAGVANYRLYALAQKQYATAAAGPFHDIVSGNNGAGGIAGFAAGAGYDFGTGIGTPDVDLLSQAFAAAACPGDCDGNGTVTVDEILTAVNIALGTQAVSPCEAADTNSDGMVTVDELLQAVNRALNGC
jgi:pseudomonalisin